MIETIINDEGIVGFYNPNTKMVECIEPSIKVKVTIQGLEDMVEMWELGMLSTTDMFQILNCMRFADLDMEAIILDKLTGLNLSK